MLIRRAPTKVPTIGKAEKDVLEPIGRRPKAENASSLQFDPYDAQRHRSGKGTQSSGWHPELLPVL
jgi:hypothetical protein